MRPQGFHAAGVVFQTRKYTADIRATYTSTTIATISTKVIFRFRLSIRVDPFSPMASPKHFQLDQPFSAGKNIERVSVLQ